MALQSDGPARLRKLSNFSRSLDGWPKIYYLELHRASEGTLNRGSRLHLQSLDPTNPHWARVVSYSPFSICIIHQEGLCPSSETLIGWWWMSTVKNLSIYRAPISYSIHCNTVLIPVHWVTIFLNFNFSVKGRIWLKFAWSVLIIRWLEHW
jgi:hypothetical protein